MSEKIQGIQGMSCPDLLLYTLRKILNKKKEEYIKKVETTLSNLEYLESPILIRSDLLDGELIAYVSDPRRLFEIHAAHVGTVMYLPQEVCELARYVDNEEMIRAVHTVKKVFGTWDQEIFGAWIVPAGAEGPKPPLHGSVQTGKRPLCTKEEA